jgi:RNA polymerase sigma factor (sigma-70 family)
MALADEDDAALVARCLRGEQAGWDTLVRRYQRLVYTVVLRAGLDEHAAADVFQTVFSRLLTHLKQLQQPERLQAWIVTTAKREALLQRSRGQRHVSLTQPEEDEGAARNDAAAAVLDLPDESALPDELISRLQQADRLQRGLARLDDRCRTLLQLLFADDDEAPAYDEVGRRLGMPVGSIGPTRARCLAKLRELLK